MKGILGAMIVLALSVLLEGCGAGNCSEWQYGGCCGLGNKAQFIRTCINPDGTERTETRCTGTCGP